MDHPQDPEPARASAVLATLAQSRSALRIRGSQSDIGQRILRDSVRRLQALVTWDLEIHLGGDRAFCCGEPVQASDEARRMIRDWTGIGIVGLAIPADAPKGEFRALLVQLAAPPSRDLHSDLVSRLRGEMLHAVRFLLAGDLAPEDQQRVARAHSAWLATHDRVPAHHALDLDASHLPPVLEDLTANLPVRVADQVLEDLADGHLSAGVALTVLADLLDDMLHRGDAAGVAWLLDEGPHGGPGGEGYRFLAPHVEDALTTDWFEGFFATAPPEQIQALVPLLAHLPTSVVDRCLGSTGLATHPDARTLLVAMAALSPQALIRRRQSAQGALAEALDDAVRWSGLGDPNRGSERKTNLKPSAGSRAIFDESAAVSKKSAPRP